jgi:hypothetical protein
VTFANVLLGDILTSLSNVIVDALAIFCSMYSIFSVAFSSDCRHRVLGPLLQSLPYIFRGWQCWIVYRLTGNRSQLINLLKYMSVIPVVVLSAIKHDSSYVLETADPHDHRVLNAWIGAVVVNTLLSVCWDVFMDWGLGWNTGPSPFFLRPTLLFRHPIIYYASIVVNLFLRLCWSLRLSVHLHAHASASAFALFFEVLEMLRRFIWIFLRVEWECIKEQLVSNLAFVDKPPTPLIMARHRSNNGIAKNGPEND